MFTGFLAQKLGGTGSVEVVITQNSFSNMITFKKGERYYSCLQTSLTEKAMSFSSHKYVNGFKLVENFDQEKKEKSRQKANVLLSGNKYHILVENHVFYCNGTTVWHHNKETNEVVINNIEKEEDNILNPAKLFENYEKNFKAKYIRENEDGTLVIDLTPVKGKEYHKIRLLIDKKTYQLKNMAMYYYDSSQTE